MKTVFIIYHVDADPWVGIPQLPIAAFTTEPDAIDFASKQKGYGFGRDWFVRAIPLDPS